MITVIIDGEHRSPPERTMDCWGQGHFGAPRGNRVHNGIDFCAAPGTAVCALSDGVVTKHGYTYSDDLSFRYIQVETAAGVDERFFYVWPAVAVGQTVKSGDVLGFTQKLGDRYPADDTHPEPITEHFHFEVKKSGSVLNTNDYLNDYAGPQNPSSISLVQKLSDPAPI